jgi:hemerythrin-like domain-containing protein
MPPRHDLFGPIHKALRARAAALLVHLGRADLTDEKLRHLLIDEVRSHLEVLCTHMWHEDEYIHPLIAVHDQGASERMAEEHREHTGLAANVHAALDELERAEGVALNEAGRRLYLTITLLLAHDFSHMHHEETVLLPRLHRWYSDDTLRAVEGRIIASFSSRELREMLESVLPALNPAEQRVLRRALPQAVMA